MSARLMRRLRQIHLYIGAFFAPAILFFAFTGALQTFDLHEPRNHPPQWLRIAAQFHKKQDFPRPRPEQRDRAPQNRPPNAPRPDSAYAHFGLKVFVGLMSISLILSTLTGVWIALSVRSARMLVWVLLVAGCGVPLVLIL